MVLQVLRSYSPQFLDNFFGEKEVTNPASPKRKVFFQEKTSSIKSITPYEGAAFSNIPAATNLFLLIPDCYSTYNALKNANKLYDMEAKSDAITRIAGFVPNFISSVGTNISYGEVLHIIPKKEVPTLFGKIFPIFGILLCIVEAVVECVSLKRQLNFLGSLHINFFDTKKKSEDPSKSPIENLYAAIKSMLDGSENFYEVLGPIKSHKHKKSLEALLVSLKNTPTIKDKHMREAKRILLHRNLTFLRAKYLELNESEMTRIAARVHSKFKDQISDKAFIEEKVQAAYSHKLIAKKMKLARRIRPGVTKAIDDKVNLLIKGLSRKSSKKVQDEAIEVGESLMRMIRTQSHKKELVHVVGIIALVFIIAGTAMLLPSSPLLLNSVILSSIGFGFGTARYLLYKGLLDSEGWKFSASNCIPKIFKRIYKACTEKKPKIEIKKGSYPSTIHLYHKRISNEERQRVNNEYLKLLARYTIPQS